MRLIWIPELAGDRLLLAFARRSIVRQEPTVAIVNVLVTVRERTGSELHINRSRPSKPQRHQPDRPGIPVRVVDAFAVFGPCPEDNR
jgi:hypothetical protein